MKLSHLLKYSFAPVSEKLENSAKTTHPFSRGGQRVKWEIRLVILIFAGKKMLSNEDILRVFLPSWLFDYFEVGKLNSEEYRIDVYLEEKKETPTSHQSEGVISHGFTDYSIVQDFPIKGKAVYLHLRRRKWLDTKSGKIVTSKFEIAYEGTRLTKEFVAFLKETNRE
jgi:hypothetical protein